MASWRSLGSLRKVLPLMQRGRMVMACWVWEMSLATSYHFIWDQPGASFSPAWMTFVWMALYTSSYAMTVGAAVMAWNMRVWIGAPITRMFSPLSSAMFRTGLLATMLRTDRKSTRLNSSHGSSSYAVFCLKK